MSETIKKISDAINIKFTETPGILPAVTHSYVNGSKKYYLGIGGTNVPYMPQPLSEEDGTGLIAAVKEKGNGTYFTNPYVDFSRVLPNHPPMHLVNLAIFLEYKKRNVKNSTYNLGTDLLMTSGMKKRVVPDNTVYIVHSGSIPGDAETVALAKLWNSTMAQYCRISGSVLLDLELFRHTTTLDELKSLLSDFVPGKATLDYNGLVDEICSKIKPLTANVDYTSGGNFLTSEFENQIATLATVTGSKYFKHFLANAHLEEAEYLASLKNL